MANYYRNEGKNVGILAISRGDPSHQLAAYADEHSLSLRTVADIPQMYGAAALFSRCDAVLIDTPGLSPLRVQALAILREILDVALPDEMHLVMPATASYTALWTAASRYAPLGVTHLAMSKFDEIDEIVALIDFFEATSWPLSFFSTGGDADEPILPATAEFLGKRI